MEKISFNNKLKEFESILKLPRQMRWLKEGFTIITNNILVADLQKELKLLYIILMMYAFRKQSCFPSVKTLAQNIGVDERTVRRNLRRLEDKGWIKVEYRNGQSSIYTLMKGGR